MYLLIYALIIHNLSSSARPLLECTLLYPGHPCQDLPDRGSNFTLPQILPVDSVIEEFDVLTSFSVFNSLRGSFPDGCLDVLEHYLCTLYSPSCDSMSNGLPMPFCEQDCVAYKMLKEEGACDSTIELIREFAGTVGNRDLEQGIVIFENFDCSNVSTFHFFESDNYAETCTGLLSKQTRGKTEQ